MNNSTPCPMCGLFANRGVTIDALIVRDNAILLIKRGKEPFLDSWAIPGGHIEWDEDANHAVNKEVLEETGLTVTSTKLLNVYTNPQRDPKQKITLAYIVDTQGEPKAGDDAKEFQWFDLNSLPELAFDHKLIIEDYIKSSV